MAFFRNTIYWDKNVLNSSVTGSIKISRSNNGPLGTYSLIGSFGPTVIAAGSYYGSSINDTYDAYYILQTYDSNSSTWSGSSEPIRPIEGLLTDMASIKRRARITGATDISDYEIYASILDITEEIANEFGDPIEHTWFTFESTTGSTVYDFTGNRTPVWKIMKLEVDGTLVPYNVGSWNVDTSRGYVQFASSYITAQDGNIVTFEYVPKIYYELATDMAALRLLEDTMIIDGDTIENSLLSLLQKSVDRIKEGVRPKGVYASSALAYDESKARYIYQSDWYLP